MAKKFCKVKGIHKAFNLNQTSSDYDFNQLKSSIQDIANSNTIMFIITDSNDASVHAKYAVGSMFIWTNGMLFNCNDTTYQAASSTLPGIVKISDTSTSSETDVAATVNQIHNLYEIIENNEYAVATYADEIKNSIGLNADLSHLDEYVEKIGNISIESALVNQINAIEKNEYVVATYANVIKESIGLNTDLSHSSEYLQIFGNVSIENALVQIMSQLNRYQ